jgi:hypothetical protein
MNYWPLALIHSSDNNVFRRAMSFSFSFGPHAGVPSNDRVARVSLPSGV